MHNLFRILFRIPHYLNKQFYRIFNMLYFTMIGVKYGKGLKVCNKIYVMGKGKIIIGDNFTFYSGASINPVCRNIRGAFFTMDNGIIRIGDNVGVSSACLWAKEGITIGNNVNIGGDCIILDNDSHSHDYLHRRREFWKKLDGREKIEDIPSKPVIIDDNTWIGARCIILKGVHIGARTIIGAGSVVVKDIPSDCIACGNPCVVIKEKAK